MTRKTNRAFLTPQEIEEQKKKHLRAGCIMLALVLTLVWTGIVWALCVIF